MSEQVIKNIKNLSAKIAAVSAEIGAIKKGGHNTEQHFDFIEYAVVSGKLRTLFEKHGVAVVPEVVDYTMDEIQSRSGKVGYHYILKMHFTVINTEDTSDKIESNWLCEAIDYGDKGINKAETSGLKYYLMRLLNISEKGDSDHEADKETPESITKTSHNHLDFEYIKSTLKTIQSEQELDNFGADIKKKNPNMTAAQAKAISAMFNGRREELR